MLLLSLSQPMERNGIKQGYILQKCIKGAMEKLLETGDLFLSW